MSASPETPAYLPAMRDADEAAERWIEQTEAAARTETAAAPSKSLLTGAICPHCKLHRGHRANCPAEQDAIAAGDYSLEAYRQFIRDKVLLAEDSGFEVDDSELHFSLLPHQRVTVKWAVRGGRRAIFASFGLGKTRIQLEILRLILKRAGGIGLIVAPLGVRQEFENEAEALGIKVRFIQSNAELVEESESPVDIYLTNYEPVRDGKLSPGKFTVASLDEAAILSGFGGVKTFREFMRLFETVKYRYVATATPDPNEYLELLAYAAFLGVLEVSDGKTRFFKRDSTKADHLTLHPHKIKEWWLFVASWALFLNKPSDLGPDFSDEGYDLPELEIVHVEVKVDHSTAIPDKHGQGRMFRNATAGIGDASREKKSTIEARVAAMKYIVDAEPEEHFILWHDLEDERRAITKALPDCVAVYGSQRSNKKTDLELERSIIGFAKGDIKYLAAKPQMFGAGVNWQRHCARAIFVGINYSFRNFIQALHRIYRFLQSKKVKIYIIFAESERPILETLLQKWERHKAQLQKMSEIIAEYGLSRIAMAQALTRSVTVARVEKKQQRFLAINNDCVEELHGMKSNSIGLVLTSPPFSHMYEYSSSYCDFGHSDGNAHFWEQMDFLIPQLLRVLQPGRIAAIHVKDRVVPSGLTGLGFQIIYPFHSDCIRNFVRHGFGFIGMKSVITDVVRENAQTYRMGWSRQCQDGTCMGYGLPEYLLFFRKPPTDSSNGWADLPVLKDKPDCLTDSGEIVPFDRDLLIKPGTGYSRSRWQIDAHGFMRSSGNRLLRPEDLEGLPHQAIFKAFRKYSNGSVYDFENHVALGEYLESKGLLPVTFMLLQPTSWHPDVWTDITRMRTLNNSQSQRGKEMHLCAMQLDLANRVIAQLSMPDEVVLDPFGGIMTVPYCAVLQGRRGIGIELSQNYWADGIEYLKSAELNRAAPTLFDMLEAEADVPEELEAASA